MRAKRRSYSLQSIEPLSDATTRLAAFSASCEGVEVPTAAIDVHGLLLMHVDGAVDVASIGMTEATAGLAFLLGNLVGALFLHGFGRLFLVQFLLCHPLRH